MSFRICGVISWSCPSPRKGVHVAEARRVEDVRAAAGSQRGEELALIGVVVRGRLVGDREVRMAGLVRGDEFGDVRVCGSMRVCPHGEGDLVRGRP